MNLDAMANFICRKVNQTEAEDVARCKDFLKQRHELIWTEALWKDALVEYRLAIAAVNADGSTSYTPASNWLPTKGVLLLPPILEKVLAVRSDKRTLTAQRQEFYYRIDYDAFAKTGDATDFVTLPGCVWETDVDADFYLARTNNGDNQLIVKADVLDSDGAGVTRQSETLDQAARSLGTSQRIDALLKDASSGDIKLQARVTGDLVAAGTTYSTATNLNGNNPWQVGDPIEYSRTISGFTVGKQYDVVLGNAVSLLDDNGQGLAADGTLTATQTSYTLTGPTGAYNGIPVIVAVTTTIQNHLFDAVTVASADESAAKRQRVRLIQIPTAALTLRVLGKRVCPSFSDDLDEPGISSAHNCLIAFGQADMLERERQYAKAQTKMQEAALLLDQLKRVEVAQQANNQRIQPEGGYGDEDIHSHCSGWGY